ncbi:hypothetical protein BDZ94DRAFT_1297190 [Collybia nuda]|uniref:Diphthine--ammonia ligase n=1 Tax=Collybia nuda TaxID=64659 RepID=A0A9P6CJK4_9AGAR|nr:hypothetical protein BDZ94DRAFT_1297190 [Collybia nuda]
MKYLALLSGGKDSCYNLVHCAKNGHELVAAASLGPGEGKEELDSYLYQTVGQDAIEFVARALETPLYRRIITGNAVEQGSEYGTRIAKDYPGVDGDETEDLFALLSEVKAHHPDVQGVSVGAILSNYQRVRVEHVCRRLGLTPLCYLWQRDQEELLSEMITSGMEAILIKVAGIGLTTEHLGKTLAVMEPSLIKLNHLYGAHICGEGGEYETLTLDCPLFKHRIVLTETETVIHSDSAFATVAFLRIKKAVLEPKTVNESLKVYIPPMLDTGFVALHDTVSESERNMTTLMVEKRKAEQDRDELQQGITHTARLGSWVSVSNIQRSIDDTPLVISIEEEVTQCFLLLKACLSQYKLDISNCTNINIFLSSIELFARVNVIYSTFFGSSPPARACVAVDLPDPIRVRLDCIAFTEIDQGDRQALHVQGLSYWAPANIGPYSQAITAGERVFISGQIGLIPGNLALPSPPSLAMEFALASQHIARITEAIRSGSGGGWVGHTQATLYWLADTNHLIQIKEALSIMPEYLSAPMLFLVVKELPKGAMIEKQVLQHTGRCTVVDEDEEPSLQPRSPLFLQDTVVLPSGGAVRWEVSRFLDTTLSFAIICVKGEDPMLPNILSTTDALGLFAKRGLSVRLFYVPKRTLSIHSIFRGLFGRSQPPITNIPCRFISTKDADDWDYALCVIGA